MSAFEEGVIPEEKENWKDGQKEGGGGRICERREIQRRGKIERESMQRELQREKTSGNHQGAERKTLDSAETLGSPRCTAHILACFVSNEHLPPKDTEQKRTITVLQIPHKIVEILSSS